MKLYLLSEIMLRESLRDYSVTIILLYHAQQLFHMVIYLLSLDLYHSKDLFQWFHSKIQNKNIMGEE